MATAFEKIQKLQEQIQAATSEALEELREARREAMAKVADIDKQIAALGAAATSSKAKGRKPSSEAVCPFCKTPGHDGRAHRSQGKNKKAFTAEELREKGLPGK